ncbi:MAG: fatty-acid oxidation protein subunit alpha [Okeania sp. SIO3C4]|nr:fatty-acid oxidation protein subunit alpha [Okeania sp. SIO3C4]
MPVRDTFHNAVRQALEKDGWRITHDPLHIDLIDIEVYIDLGAEKLLAAERNNEKIAVEIKNFLGSSTISEFHLALGQFINYRFVLGEFEPERQLYLAVPFETYQVFFRRELIKKITQQQQLKFMIYEPTSEVIQQWII